MAFDYEHAKQWMVDHLWEYFPDKQIPCTHEGYTTLNKMFQDYVDEHYTPNVSDSVYDEDTRTFSVSVGFKRKEK